MEHAADVLIVGAGLTGLTAAAGLRAANLQVIVLDKGRNVGGRLATRQLDQGAADTGAQFFSVRSDQFRAQVDEWLAQGLVFEWSRGWSDGSLSTTREGHPRYAVNGGMNTLAKHLAEGLDVRLLYLVASVQRIEGGWQVTAANGDTLSARALVLTAPVPQSLDLVREGGVELPFEARSLLEAIDYNPSICGLFVLAQSPGLPSPGAVQRPHANLFWVADNQRKGISPGAIVLTAQASSTYSRALWDADDATVIKSMQLDLMPFLGESTQILSAEIKRWRYAMPVSPAAEPALAVDIPLAGAAPAPLVFAGDAFGAARMEGAYLSGRAAARMVQAGLKN